MWWERSSSCNQGIMYLLRSQQIMTTCFSFDISLQTDYFSCVASSFALITALLDSKVEMGRMKFMVCLVSIRRPLMIGTPCTTGGSPRGSCPLIQRAWKCVFMFMPESSKKLLPSTGRVQRCSSECMSCMILCCVCVGSVGRSAQCRLGPVHN